MPTRKIERTFLFTTYLAKLGISQYYFCPEKCIFVKYHQSAFLQKVQAFNSLLFVGSIIFISMQIIRFTFMHDCTSLIFSIICETGLLIGYALYAMSNWGADCLFQVANASLISIKKLQGKNFLGFMLSKFL